ncbi:MAG: VanZ family protein [Vicinamibacteria bacterium]
MPGFFRFWGPVLLYMGLIFWSSSRPRPEVVATTPDYLLHGPAYFLLAVLAVRGFAKGLDADPKALEIAGGVALAVLYGMSDEWHQLAVPGRDGSLRDVLLDAAGAVAGGASIAAVGRFRKSSDEGRAR